MQCSRFDVGACRSCALIPQPYAEQVAGKEAHCRDLLADHPGLRWLPTVTGPEAGYRNKAKMVVGGTVDRPTLGILDRAGRGTDLRTCPVCTDGIRAALPVLAAFVTRAGLTPYDVPARRGELKFVHVTEAPSGELMVRFVLRSTDRLGSLRRHLPWLLQRLPPAVVSANLLPEHRAVLEGEEEVALTERRSLLVELPGGPALQLRPRSFLQTNSAVAARLYAQAVAWADEVAPATVWDLYCGVGGFALSLAAPGRRVTGVETSAEAVRSARAAARAAGLTDVDFLAGDATAFARDAGRVPDLVVVNPPRRGVGAELAAWLDGSGVEHVVYSSCNAATLAADLAAMPSLAPVRARVLDMFPQTPHYEVAVLLRRAAG